jgi:gliding motility-associated-like protein
MPQNEGFLTVQLEDIHHCLNSDTIYIHLDEVPAAPMSINFGQNYYCSFDDSISLVVKGGEGNCLKLNYGLSQIIDSIPNALQYKVPNPGTTFDVSASWMNFCGESAELVQTIDVFNEANPGIQLHSNFADLELGDMVSIVAEIQDGGDNPQLLWYVDNKLVQIGANNEFTSNEFGKTQNVEVVMFSNEKCLLNASSVSDNIQISLNSERDFYIPTVVTPNGDGIDDYFRVFFKDREIDYFKLNIFDVRGRLLFSTTNKDFNWDGNNTLSSGGMVVLTYMIQYKYPNALEKSLSGKFLLKK